MKTKIFTLLCLSAFAVFTAQAQRITSFTLDNATSLGHSCAFNPTNNDETSPGDLQIVYPQGADLTNSNAVMEGTFTLVTDPMPTDWSTVQNIQVMTTSDDGVDSHAWYDITCKVINPTTLPLYLDASSNLGDNWTTETEGWAAACIAKNQTNIRFGNAYANFILAFTDTPDSLFYSINIAAETASAGTVFDVEESADGITWTQIAQYTEENFPGSQATSAEKAQAHELLSTTRYVRWYYSTRVSGNVSLTSDLIVTKGEDVDGGDGEPDDEPEDGIFNTSKAVEIALSPVPAVDVLNISAPEAVATVTICNIAGQTVASYANVGTQVSVSNLAAGSYLAIVTLEDGTKAVKSFIKK